MRCGRDWVREGGSLLLIADHTPFGTAAYHLAIRFGAAMGKGWVFEPKPEGRITTQLTFSRANRLLGIHPIMLGRDSSEEVKSVLSFTGQSLSLPEGATALMKLSPNAGESGDPTVPEREDTIVRGKQASGPRANSAAGRAQGLAMTFGKGRVVMLGEMLSAQIARMTENGKQVERKMGMNVPGHDDRNLPSMSSIGCPGCWSSARQNP
jgi:hypothetical protein